MENTCQNENELSLQRVNDRTKHIQILKEMPL